MKHSLFIATLFSLGALTVNAVCAQDNVPAFPGAEGFARYTTTGGRGGKVYHVTNLTDDENKEGSLRWCLKQSGPRTVVFDVSGYIDLTQELKIPGNTTIAGQTAPGDGITLRYYTVRGDGGDNIICRYIRFRRSQVKDVNDGADATWGRYKKNIIFDHCSFSWSIDEIASYYDNKDFTMQWCTLGEALANPGHSKGEHSYGGIWGGKGASFHHNFLCHLQNRAPRFNGARYGWAGGNNDEYANPIQAERVDFRNCVMYNWGSGNGCYGGSGGGYINIVNNYYQAGPGTANKTRVTEVSVATKDNASGCEPYWGYASRYFIEGNYVTAAAEDKRENYDWSGVKYDTGLFDKKDAEGNKLKDEKGLTYKLIPDAEHKYGETVEYIQNENGVDCVELRLTEAIAAGEVTTHSAQEAYEKVLSYVGASLVRDAVDARYMEEARTGTVNYTGAVSKRAGIVDKINDPEGEEDPTTVSFPALREVTRPADFDTDGDGMPDEWEEANGLDKNNAADGNLYTLDSEKQWYTNLEVYMNGLVEYITRAQNADAVVSVDEYYPVQQFVAGIREVGSYDVKSIEYYDLNGVCLSAPQSGVNIRRILYTNGKYEVQKVLQ